MNFKKKVSGSWTDTPHYIHNTSTDTLTTLPADIYANDTTATVGLKGQTVQSGTPSPSSPITPSECGERTGNLCDESTIQNGYYGSSGSISTFTNDDRYRAFQMPIKAGTYTVKIQADEGIRLLRIATVNEFYNVQEDNRAYTFVISSDAIVYVSWRNLQTTNSFTNMTVMLNTGSTALPYEPYGIKIPILSASTTTPVYLGEVETTRRIKKYVFTGEENGTVYSTGTSRKGIEITGIAGIIGGNADIAILAICTHYQPYARNTLYRNTDNGISNAYQNDKIIFYDASCQTVEAFQQFCTQQYAAGTPVTVWYVLATPTTGIVNEPLRKIGDYADEVSGITIPTIAGANTLSIGTTLQPSEVTVNYKGWHPVADVHERENGQWD